MPGRHRITRVRPTNQNLTGGETPRGHDLGHNSAVQI